MKTPFAHQLMKTCTKCGQVKDKDEFSPQGRTLKDGSRPFRADCKVCCRDKARHYRKVYPEKVKEASRRHYKVNKEKCDERKRKWIMENRFRHAISKSHFDAKEKDYFPCDAAPEELEAAFTGKCHYCGKTEEGNGKRLGIDHDHDTGRFRGWLCYICNARDVFATKEISNES